MKRSEIFDNFVKIAQEKGLISKSEAEHTETSFSETNPRHDSLSIEQIGKLYNTKPEQPKDMQYKNNIMEDAHPDSVVISPSYDKLNGLVENDIEGQNIRLRIVMKEPDGHLTQRKYAQKDLILSLVSIANQLDNLDKTELCKLADVCLEQVAEKKILKTAQVLEGAALIGALLAAVYAKQHLRFHSEGFEADYQKTIAEIDDLLNANSNWGVGYTYTPAFIQTVNELKTVLSTLHTEVQRVVPVLDSFEKPHTKAELIQMSNQEDTHEGIRAIEEFKQVVDKINPFLQKIMIDFNNEGYKQRAIAQRGALTSIIDAPEFLHGGAGLIADDFDDVKHALQTLILDVTNIVKGLNAYDSFKQKATQEIQSSQNEVGQIFNSPTPEAEKPAKTDEVGNLESETEGLMGGLLGK